jgi:hypothetical protein
VLFLRELRHKEKIGEYFKAKEAAEALGMDNKTRSLVSKYINQKIQEVKKHNESCEILEFRQCLNYNSIYNDCKKYKLEKKIPNIKKAEIEELLLTSYEWKAINICKELGMNDKAKEIALKELNKIEKKENYARAIEVCKEWGFDEKISKLYESWIDSKIKSAEEQKYYFASEIAKEAGFKKKAEELLRISIENDEIDNIEQLEKACRNVGMIMEADNYAKLKSILQK